MKKIRVMIADDIPLWRDTLNGILNTDRIDVVGLAANGLELLDLVRGNLPDIVVLDLNMPVMDGFNTLKCLSKDFPTIKTLILSDDCTDFFVATVILEGCRGYLKKTSKGTEIIKAVQCLYDEGYFFNKIVSQEILHTLKSKKKIYYLMNNYRFSEREIEVLKQICDDLTNEEIADNLHIAVSTVKFHKKNLFQKTESDSLVSLVKYAIKQGIIKN